MMENTNYMKSDLPPQELKAYMPTETGYEELKSPDDTLPSNSEEIPPVPRMQGNRAWRRAMHKKDIAFAKKYQKPLEKLEKFVKEHGFEELNAYLEDLQRRKKEAFEKAMQVKEELKQEDNDKVGD